MILDEPPQRATAVTEAVRLRDDAALELLYGSGLRVSELCGLSMDDVDGRRPLGDGVGQRVPSNAGCQFPKTRPEPSGGGWPTAVRTWQSRGRRPDALFLNSRGHRLGPRDVRRILDRRSPVADSPPRTAPQFCHPHAGRGRRPESRAGASRPRQREDDPGLHPCEQGAPPGRLRPLPPEGLMRLQPKAWRDRDRLGLVPPRVAFAWLPLGRTRSTGRAARAADGAHC